MWSSRRTGGIGSRARNGVAASAAGGSAVSGRPPLLPRIGRSVARAPPPRAPRKARRPKRRRGAEDCPAVALGDRDGRRSDRRDDVDLALHPGVNGAHVVERRARCGGHFLAEGLALLFREPGVALLAGGVAVGAPAGGAGLGGVLRDLFGFRVEAVPDRDREADVLRG